MKKTIIAAIAANGVVGRTRKPCSECNGTGLIWPSNPVSPACNPCKGHGTVPANDLPWGRAYPEDLARFKATTMGHAVIMGRRTWESLPPKQRPLPGRQNVVVGHISFEDNHHAIQAVSLEAALDRARRFGGPHREDDDPMHAFIIGGPRLWRDALPIADELDLTLIGRAWEGDVRFPEPAFCPWIETMIGFANTTFGYSFECVSREPCPTNAELTFTTWKRR